MSRLHTSRLTCPSLTRLLTFEPKHAAHAVSGCESKNRLRCRETVCRGQGLDDEIARLSRPSPGGSVFHDVFPSSVGGVLIRSVRNFEGRILVRR
jgi:hypothetical protein